MIQSKALAGAVACLLLGTADLAVINLVVGPSALEPAPAPTSSQTSGESIPAPRAADPAAAPAPPGTSADPVPEQEPAGQPAAPAVAPAVAPAAASPAVPEAEPETTPKTPPAVDRPPAGDIPLKASPLRLSFETNSSVLGASQRALLARGKALLLRASRRGLIRVDGHTDNRGAESYNRRLSHRRAETVGEMLRAWGIPKKGIIMRGLGASRARSTGSTSAALALNRRAEIYLTPLKDKATK